MRRRAKILLPIAVLAASLLTAALLVAARQDVARTAPVVQPPLVRVLAVAPRPVELVVRTQGTVVPRTESDLVAEVAGRVIWVSPALASGGFFAAGDPLLRIDPVDYRVAVERARAGAEARRSEERVNARNLDRGRRLAGEGLISARDLEIAENAAALARASRREAEAALEQAEIDLARTEMHAPFAGRVREERVDVGQFVARGTTLGRIYAVDYAEVRLPITAEDVAFLSLRLDGAGDDGDGPAVVLRADFAGAAREWHGRVVRTEGEIDPRSRMVHVVARVDDPYGRAVERPGVPLAVGLFVAAEIRGRTIPEAVVLPRAALHGADQVLTVDGESRLRVRTVEVLRRQGDEVVVRSGLVAGERVCLSQIEAAVDGMRVRTAAEPS